MDICLTGKHQSGEHQTQIICSAPVIWGAHHLLLAAAFLFVWVFAKKLFTLLDLCVSSLRRGHANLLCIVPILTDDPRRGSNIMVIFWDDLSPLCQSIFWYECLSLRQNALNPVKTRWGGEDQLTKGACQSSLCLSISTCNGRNRNRQRLLWHII